MLLGERQAEDVLVGQHPSQVPWVLVGRVDLRRTRRDLFDGDAAHEIAELPQIGRDVVQIGELGGGAHAPTRSAAGAYS